MDLLLAHNFLVERARKKERYAENAPGALTALATGTSTGTSLIARLVMMLWGFAWVWVSWDCNTRQGMSLPMKLLWALLVYYSSSVYWLYYLFFRFHDCKTSR